MKNNKCCKRDGGYEIAISRKDLRIKGYCRILEKKSKGGFRESPAVKYPKKHTISNKLIQYDQDWCVEFRWRVYGPLACLLDCGYWKTKIFFEQMGGAETRYSPEAITPDVGRPGQRYRARVQVRRGALKPGIYRVVCCSQYCIKKGQPGPIVGFHDLGLIKIYKDKVKKVRQPHAELATVENGEEL